MQKLIYLISLLLTFLQIARDGLVICWQMMVKGFTWIIKNGKNPLYIILNKSVELLFLILATVGFLLMMAFFVLMDSIQESYVYLFKKRLVTRPRSCLITFLTLLKIGIKRLPRKLYGLKSHLRWPE